jgi:hypothetical protein
MRRLRAALVGLLGRLGQRSQVGAATFSMDGALATGQDGGALYRPLRVSDPGTGAGDAGDPSGSGADSEGDGDEEGVWGGNDSPPGSGLASGNAGMEGAHTLSIRPAAAASVGVVVVGGQPVLGTHRGVDGANATVSVGHAPLPLPLSGPGLAVETGEEYLSPAGPLAVAGSGRENGAGGVEVGELQHPAAGAAGAVSAGPTFGGVDEDGGPVGLAGGGGMNGEGSSELQHGVAGPVIAGAGRPEATPAASGGQGNEGGAGRCPGGVAPCVLSWENVTVRVLLPGGRERYVLQVRWVVL